MTWLESSEKHINQINDFCKKKGIEIIWRFDSLWGEMYMKTRKDGIEYELRYPMHGEKPLSIVVISRLKKVYNV